MLRMKRGLVLSDGEEQEKDNRRNSISPLHRIHHIYNALV